MSAKIRVSLAHPELYETTNKFDGPNGPVWLGLDRLPGTIGSQQLFEFEFSGYADPLKHYHTSSVSKEYRRCSDVRGSFYLNSGGYAQEVDLKRPPAIRPAPERILLTPAFRIRRKSIQHKTFEELRFLLEDIAAGDMSRDGMIAAAKEYLK